jgi:hypothetical protein
LTSGTAGSPYTGHLQSDLSADNVTVDKFFLAVFLAKALGLHFPNRWREGLGDDLRERGHPISFQKPRRAFPFGIQVGGIL